MIRRVVANTIRSVQRNTLNTKPFTINVPSSTTTTMANMNHKQHQRMIFKYMAPTESMTRNYAIKHGDKGPSLFGEMKEIFKQEMNKNKDLQKNLKELKETKTVKAAKKTGEVMSGTSDKFTKATAPARDGLSKVASATFDSAGKAGKAVADSAAGKAAVTGAKAVAAAPGVRHLIDEFTYEDRQRKQLSYIFRTEFGRKKDEERGIYWNPYTKQMEKYEDIATDEDTMDVVLTDKRTTPNSLSGISNRIATMSNRFSEGSAMRGIFQSTQNVVESIGRSEIMQNEYADALSDIKANDKTFDLDIFLGNLKHIVIPEILDAYFNDDAERIKQWVSEAAFNGYVGPHIQSRIQQKIKFDTEILQIEDTDVYFIKYIEDFPTIAAHSRVSYIYCIKDKDGEVVEGGEQDIRSETHTYFFRQDTSGKTLDWECCAVDFGQAERVL